jgi:PAS domain S-box-containing protein
MGETIAILGLITTIVMGIITALWTIYTKQVKPRIDTWELNMLNLSDSTKEIKTVTEANSKDLKILSGQLSKLENRFEKETHTNGGSSLKDDLKSIKNQLLLSTKTSESLLYLDPNPIFRTDSDGDFTLVNYKYLQIGGFTTQEDALGKGWLKAVHIDDRDRVEKEWEESIYAESIFETTYRCYNQLTGKVLMVSIRTTPVRDGNKEVISYVGVVQILF